MSIEGTPSLFLPCHAMSFQSRSTLCDLMDCNLPGSSVHGMLQARILEWVDISSFGGPSRLRDQTPVTLGLYFSVTLAWDTGGQESACQCKRHMFNPRVRKIPCSKKPKPIPAFLLGGVHGQRSLAGYSPCGHKELDMTD